MDNKLIEQISEIKDPIVIEIINKLLKIIKDLETQAQIQIQILTEENADLRRRVNMNSRNSHKPPSTDGFKKIIKKFDSTKTDAKKLGGQVGHKGQSLSFSEMVDEVIEIKAQTCEKCQHEFSSDDIVEGVERHQVYDIPPPKTTVKEYRALKCLCKHCGHIQKGSFPKEARTSVQYGSGLRALLVYLNTGLNIPLKKITPLIEQLYGLKINTATIIEAVKLGAKQLDPTLKSIEQHLVRSEVLHADETSIRVKAKNNWIHVLSNSLWTLLKFHSKRGLDGTQESFPFLENFEGTLVHDFWKAYQYFNHFSHSYCCAHLLRELNNLLENDKTTWSKLMIILLIDMYKECNEAKSSLSETKFNEFSNRYDDICNMGNLTEPLSPTKTGKRGRPKQTKGRNLLERFIQHKSEILAFAKYDHIPFTNNLAERDLRCVKTKLKVATEFRSIFGAHNYAILQSFISTINKQSGNIYKELINLFQNENYCFVPIIQKDST
jgi:transposase